MARHTINGLQDQVDWQDDAIADLLQAPYGSVFLREVHNRLGAETDAKGILNGFADRTVLCSEVCETGSTSRRAVAMAAF